MPPASEKIPELIEREPVLQIALERGMINGSGAARWLRDEYDLDEEVETIAQYVREFEPEDTPHKWRTGQEALEDGAHRVRSNMALLIVRRSGKSQQRLAKVLGNLDGPGMHAIRIEPTRKHFQVVVKADLQDEFEQQLQQSWVTEPKEDLVEVSVATGEPEDDPSPALSAALEALHQRNIPVPFATSGPVGITLLVPEDMRLEAHDIIKDLTGSEDPS